MYVETAFCVLCWCLKIIDKFAIWKFQHALFYSCYKWKSQICEFEKKIRPLLHVIPHVVPEVLPPMDPLPRFRLRIPLWYGRWRIYRKLQYCADTCAPIPWDSGTAHSPGADILCTNCNLSANSIWNWEQVLLKIDTCNKPIATVTLGLLAFDYFSYPIAFAILPRYTVELR